MRVKSEERRQAIIETAKAEFAKHGFNQTSMSMIAKKLGGSKATLYNYFSSKDEIFASVMESAAQQITTAFQSLSTDMDIRTALISFGTKYLTSLFSPELAQIAKMAYTETGQSNLGEYFYNNGPKKGLNEIEAFIKYHIKNKNIRACDNKIAALQFRALLDAELREPFTLGVIKEQPSQQKLEEVVKRAVDTFLIVYTEK